MKWKKICALICATLLVSSTALSAEKKSSSKNSSTEKIKATDELKADEIDYDMNTEKVVASGKVFMKHNEKAAAKNAKGKKKDVPSEVNADKVDYDMKTGVVTATGNVLLKHGTGKEMAKATGERAMYNVNTQEAYLTGKVIVTRENLKVTCDILKNDGQGYIQADGNVNGTQKIPADEKYPKGDVRTFKGDHVDYYPDEKNHIIIPGGGILTSQVEGKFTADYIEGWIDDEYYFGTGNVSIDNPPKEMKGGGDRIDYYANENGKAILSGNAWVTQKNNTMRGNRLTVYLADEQTQNKPAENSLPHENLLDSPFQN